MRIRTNGDAIAHEFQKLMNKKPALNKKASSSGEPVDSVSGGDTTVLLEKTNSISDEISDADFEGLVNGPSDPNDDTLIDKLDESLEGLSDESEMTGPVKMARKTESFISPRGIKVMHGLGKIAASLRSKGENFAADVVEATAMSISGDLKKEASEKKSVINHLNKVASKLDRNGDKFAGDLVRTTIDNIIKK